MKKKLTEMEKFRLELSKRYKQRIDLVLSGEGDSDWRLKYRRRKKKETKK